MEFDYTVILDYLLRFAGVGCGIFLLSHAPRIYFNTTSPKPLIATVLFLFFGTALAGSSVWARFSITWNGSGFSSNLETIRTELNSLQENQQMMVAAVKSAAMQVAENRREFQVAVSDIRENQERSFQLASQIESFDKKVVNFANLQTQISKIAEKNTSLILEGDKQIAELISNTKSIKSKLDDTAASLDTLSGIADYLEQDVPRSQAEENYENGTLEFLPFLLQRQYPEILGGNSGIQDFQMGPPRDGSN